MPSDQPLMRPLRSDSLKPRSSTQAALPAKEHSPAPEVPDLSFMMSDNTVPLPASHPAFHFSFPEQNTEQPSPPAEPAPLPLFSYKESSDGHPSLEASLSKALADLLADEEVSEEDTEENAVSQDAIPDHLIPQPACVPLFDDPPPKRSKLRWPWLLAVVLALAAGGAFAAWKCGYLPINLP